ncbi:unnamed protein product [Ectocarpus sp. 12 AP-2014]
MVLNCMTSRRLYAETQGQSSHQDSAALPLASTGRKMMKRGRSHCGRHSLALSLAVGLLRSSTSPAPACAFLLPGAVSRSSSIGLGSRSAMGISPGRSSFAGSSSCVVGAAQSSIRRSRSRAAGGAGGPLRMGIPKLFRWLTDQYPVISQRLDQGLNEHTAPIDNLYLDMNGVIHMCTHHNDDEFIELNEKEMFRRIFIFTDRMFKLVRPRRLMYLAVDGTAPRAKMNQQRSRRFRSSKEAEVNMAEMVMRDGKLPEVTRFDSNCITPGTDFMFKLTKAFQAWIEYKMDTDPFWQQNARVVFSGPDVPGEGEHKVMDYIREARETEPDWRDDLRHCLYGLDADLIMLSLVTHEKHFSLLREKMSVRHSRRKKPKDPITYTRNDFELMEVSLLREMLRLQFQSQANDPKLPFKFELERVIDDFVFMCILVGNDFLPNVPHLDISDGALNHMMNMYKLLLPKMGGYLTKKDQIHHGRLEMFMHEVSRREAMYFRRRGVEESDLVLQDPGKYTDRYYKTKLNLDPEQEEEKRAVVKHYLEGLYWVLKYYHVGVDAGGSWSWYYPYLYAPLASSMTNLMDIKISFEKGRPFPNLLQLLSVLPPQSADFLPGPYKALMVEPTSPILEYYPTEFECDANGKTASWETVVKIPFIDEKDVFGALSNVDHTKDLEAVDRLRNYTGKVWQFLPQFRLTPTGEPTNPVPQPAGKVRDSKK